MNKPTSSAASDNAITSRSLRLLQASEIRYRRLFETARDGILLLNADTGQIEDVNPYLIEMLGYSHAQFLGKKLWEVGTFADTAQSMEMLLEIQRNGYVRYDDLPLRTKAGKTVEVEFVSNSYECEGIRVIQCNIRNVTAHKAAEAAVLREQNFTRVTLESLPGLFYLIDDQRRFIRWNRNIETVSGYSTEEISQLAPTDFFSGPDKQIVAEAVRQCFLVGEVTVEADFVAKNRTVTPYVFSGARIDIDGKQHLIGMGIDIAVRRRTEQERDRLATILEYTTDFVSMSDPAGRLLYLNRAGRRGLGVDLQEEISRTAISDFVADPATHPLLTKAIPAAIRDGAWSGETLLLSRSGRNIPVSQVILAHTSIGGELTFLSSIMRDITERKSMEARIERLNRVSAMLSGINSLIVRVGNRDDLFREACRIAVEAGAFRMAWIGVIDPQTLDVKVVASYGRKEGYADNSRFAAHDGTPYSERPASRAWREGRPIICNDIATDPRVGRHRDELLKSGHKSMGCFPLTVSGRTEAILALVADESGIFDDAEMKLLQELASDIAFALDHLGKSERISYLAYYDALTGLANRTLFHERLQQCLVVATAKGQHVGLVLIDIERFKAINDTHGRQVGDALLTEVTARLTQYAPDKNCLARIDADHFAVFVPDMPTAEALAHQVEQRMEQVFGNSYTIERIELRISAKCGIAMFQGDSADADALIANAESALKGAKSSGERLLFYTHAMSARVAERLSLENQLRQAIEGQEFVLHYQPKMSMATGKLTGAEALIRWNNPRAGLVPPKQFIQILEETGMIHEVGRWANRKAVSDYLRWRAAGLAAVRISVNVSPLQLRHRDFISDLEKIVDVDAGAAAGLELEITEGVIMEDITRSIASLKAIRAMGVTVAIDDFGTGFSSLGYLAKLPIDSLKIDRSFIVGMTSGASGLALVSTIVNLAHSLQLKVVAEGVETNEQSRLLRSLGCDEVQGFLFGRPVPIGTFEEKFLVALQPSHHQEARS